MACSLEFILKINDIVAAYNIASLPIEKQYTLTPLAIHLQSHENMQKQEQNKGINDRETLIRHMV